MGSEEGVKIRGGGMLSRSTKSLGHGRFARMNVRPHLEFVKGERSMGFMHLLMS